MPSDNGGSPDALPEPGSASASSPSTVPPSLAKLFLLCFRIGLVSFGGGLTSWFYREFVLLRGWMSDDDFASLQAISQMLPGPNVANLAICIGDQLRGTAGALTCLVGFVVGPFFVVIAVSVLFESVANNGLVQAASNGVAFTALGLMMILCIRGIKRAMRFPSSVGVVTTTAVAVGVLNWPLIPVVIGMAAIGVGMAWRRL
ncbi:chromate transporter [Microvirga alba]|uniref:Chromate transporter n=1 Tax=Microvirga alba TaxID=2791025 RepID=A0A931BX06_9HYPH|nr:chromate transporter [Microvirga alba]MBF9235375.1 chromate transporter [Microvirga alba]